MQAKKVVFGTPLFQYHLKDAELNKALTNHYLAEESKDAIGCPKSNSGGWHSQISFQDPGVNCLNKLRQDAFECFQDVLLHSLTQSWTTKWAQQSWAVINRKNDYNIPHCHPASEWSSVYYVDAGDKFEVTDPDRRKGFSGRIQFMDPRGSLMESCKRLNTVGNFYDEMYGPYNITLIPYTGLLVFFPAWLMHQVLPYQGDKPRVVISTNYILEKAETVG